MFFFVSAVESVRRLLLHHVSEVQASEPCCLSDIIAAVTEAAASLRSSTSRNAILCLQLIIESQQRFELSIEHITHILSSLMHRTAVGPKFVADSAYCAISAAILLIPFSTMFHILQTFSQHKNADTANKAFVVGSRALLTELLEPSCKQTVETLLPQLLSFFGAGLTSKRIEGKQASRKALLSIKACIGDSEFELHIQVLPSMVQAVIRKDICSESSSTAILPPETEVSPAKRKLRAKVLQKKSRLTELFSDTDFLVADSRVQKSEKRGSAVIISGNSSLPHTQVKG